MVHLALGVNLGYVGSTSIIILSMMISVSLAYIVLGYVRTSSTAISLVLGSISEVVILKHSCMDAARILSYSSIFHRIASHVLEGGQFEEAARIVDEVWPEIEKYYEAEDQDLDPYGTGDYKPRPKKAIVTDVNGREIRVAIHFVSRGLGLGPGAAAETVRNSENGTARIIINLDTDGRLSRDQLHSILVHELTHAAQYNRPTSYNPSENVELDNWIAEPQEVEAIKAQFVQWLENMVPKLTRMIGQPKSDWSDIITNISTTWSEKVLEGKIPERPFQTILYDQIVNGRIGRAMMDELRRMIGVQPDVVLVADNPIELHRYIITSKKKPAPLVDRSIPGNLRYLPGREPATKAASMHGHQQNSGIRETMGTSHPSGRREHRVSV